MLVGRLTRGSVLAALLVALCWALPAQAEQGSAEAANGMVSPDPPAGQDAGVGEDGSDADIHPGVPRPLAVVLSVVPGLLIGGSGHFALGHRRTAYRLLALQGVATALMLAGTVPLVLLVANRYATTPLAVTAISGVAVGSSGWLADVYGSAVPLHLRGRPQLRLPHIAGEFGYRYVHQGAFDYANFVVSGLELRWGALRLEPSAWYALDDPNARLRALAAYRYFGPRAAPARASRDGTFLDVEVAVTHHHFGTEGFDTVTGEVFSNGRYDLARYDAMLAGMYAQLGLGLGLQHFVFDGGAADSATEQAWLLLGRFGFGAYLGREAPPHGELFIYYDHRHDDFAAGMTGAMVGIPGHAGVEAELFVTDHLGVGAEAQIGAAFVAGASLLFRQEAAP